MTQLPPHSSAHPQTLRRLTIILGLILFMMYGLNPTLNLLGLNAYRYSADARAFSKEIIPMTEAHVKELSEHSSKPLMLHIYASWCPFCTQQNPAIMELIDQNKNKVDAVLISLDTDKYRLAQFLLSKPQPLAFKPFVLSDDARQPLRAFLDGTGGNFAGSIPYTIFINTEGKMVAEFNGLTDKAALEAGLSKARAAQKTAEKAAENTAEKN